MYTQYITWVSNNQVSWTLNAAGLAADESVQISNRIVSPEPMVSMPSPILLSISYSANMRLQYIIMNLGMSRNFGTVDLAHLPFPVHMRVDYVRVYQRSDQKNVGCDPPNYPTQAYIKQYVSLLLRVRKYSVLIGSIGTSTPTRTRI